MNIEELAAQHDEAMRRGDTTTCIRVLRELISHAKRLGNRVLEADFLRQMANAHHERGELREAHSLRVAASDLARQTPGFPPQVLQWIENDVGRSYIQVRNWELAEAHTDRAIAMAEQIGAEREQCIAIMNMAIICSNTGRSAEARRLAEEVVRKAEQADDHYTMALQYMNLSLWSLNDRRLTESVRYARLAADKAELQGDARIRDGAQGLLGQALIYARGLTQGTLDSDEARRHLQEAVETARALHHRDTQLAALDQLADMHEFGGRNDDANRCFEEMLQLLEEARADLGYEDFQLSFFRSFEARYGRIVEFLLRQSRTDEAFRVSEQVRSRILLALLGRGAGKVESWEASRRQTLVETLKDYGDTAIVQVAGAGPLRDITLGIRPHKDDLAPPDDPRLAAARRKFLNLYESQRLHRTHWDRWQSPPVIEFPQAQRELAADEAVLSYLVTEQSIVIFVATAESRHFQHLAYPADKIADDVAEVCTAMAAVQDAVLSNERWFTRDGSEPWPAPVTGAWSRLERSLRKLYALLIAPVLGAINSHQHWIVVPHGPLHRLPWAALRLGDRYLVEDHTVSLLPSVSFGAAVRDRAPSSRKDAVFFADPDSEDCRWRLPAAQREVAAARACLGEGPAPFIGPAATKAELFRQAPKARVLHIACHHQFDAAAPLLSFLKMAGPDGAHFLYAFEITELRLEADLVALSACQSGRSHIATGDEQMGIVRAFLAAGARSVVSTLWSIEDESAAEFFARFYNATRTVDLASALGSTQRSFLQDHRFMLPNFWAPYQLIGSWNQRLR
jgi:tetratricopeptide (TPR) repeat protein